MLRENDAVGKDAGGAVNHKDTKDRSLGCQRHNAGRDGDARDWRQCVGCGFQLLLLEDLEVPVCVCVCVV